ncbi:MAG: CHRD domain-containing protein [Solirubrobacteraceae bacterium]
MRARFIRPEPHGAGARCGCLRHQQSERCQLIKRVGPRSKAGGPLHIYRVRLIGGKAETPPGAPQGTGDAIIAFHGSSLVCWRFAHLHGFFNPTFAHIHNGVKGKSGKIVVPLSIGPTLRHQGCVPVTAVLVKAIERHPGAYYVNIHSKQYPGGALRAQL